MVYTFLLYFFSFHYNCQLVNINYRKNLERGAKAPSRLPGLYGPEIKHFYSLTGHQDYPRTIPRGTQL